ncbi:DUF6380 family protein [Streptomyces sp. NPDC100445]
MDLPGPGGRGRATPRRGVASLTATAGRAPFDQHVRHARKDAR